MPRIPDPPRKGHPARPRRENDGHDKAADTPARSYGQSAPMPEDPSEEELATKKPVRLPEPDDLEDLTLEPLRENGDDDEGEPEAV